MKTLFVRIHPKSGQERFFRCGMEFAKAWGPVQVDAATKQRLEQEQMLQTSETLPDELAEILQKEAGEQAERFGEDLTRFERVLADMAAKPSHVMHEGHVDGSGQGIDVQTPGADATQQAPAASDAQAHTADTGAAVQAPAAGDAQAQTGGNATQVPAVSDPAPVTPTATTGKKAPVTTAPAAGKKGRK